MGQFRGKWATWMPSRGENDPFSSVPGGSWGLELQGEGDGAVVAAEDVAADAGAAYVAGDCVAYQEVVDAPACVVLAGIKAVAPPAVDALDVGVCRAPGVGKTGVAQ